MVGGCGWFAEAIASWWCGVVDGNGGGGGGCEFARLRRKRCDFVGWSWFKKERETKRCDFVGWSWFKKERETEKKGERHRKNKNNNKEIIFKWGGKK